MRFTVKLKLVLAFGVIILLSAAAGAVAVGKLTTLNETVAAIISGPAERVQAAGQLRAHLLLSTRAEMNALLESEDEPTARFAAEAVRERGEFRKQLDATAANATEGKAQLAKIGASLDRWSELQDQTLTFTKLNSASHAHALLNTDGKTALTQTLAALDRLGAQDDKTGAAAARMRAALDAVMGTAATYVAADDLQELDQDGKLMAEAIDAAHREKDALRASMPGAGAAFEAFETAFGTWAGAIGRAATLNRDGGQLHAVAISTGEERKVGNGIDAELEQYIAQKQADMAAAKQQAEDEYEQARLLLISCVAVSLLVALGAAIWLSVSLTRALRHAGDLAQGVASGDLTRTIDRVAHDEIGDLVGYMNTMVLRLRNVVTEASSASENVASGSQELSSSSEELSQGATEQASAAEEVSASMEQMSANIKQNADNATQTEKIARQSAGDAETSGSAVNRAVEAMRTIAEKITIVQEIARQTDLLALNAAVEAARAGEHGRGFAVVASEVRKLAERSQGAAAEISTLSTHTLKAAQEAGEMLARLVPDIRKTAQLVAEISAACREQDIGSDQINKAIQQLDKVTQQNAAASEQMSATSEELAAQAEQLQTAIGYFRTEAAGAAPVRHAPAARAKAARPTVARQPANGGSPARRGSLSGRGDAPDRVGGAGVALDLAGGGHDAHDAEFERDPS